MYKLIVILLTTISLCGCVGSDGAIAPSLGGDVYSVGGKVAGLNGMLVLTNNGVDTLTVTGQQFTFSKRLSYLDQYNVEIKTNPINQVCTIADGTGEIATKNIDTVNISCVGIPFIGNRIPVQDAFTITASLATGNEYNVTVTLTDRNHYSIADGTRINFRAESGSIQPSCITSRNGNDVSTCSVIFTATTVPSDKKITILAYTEGQENFIDQNSNGVFDPAEAYTDSNNNGSYDVAETYVDANGNGKFDYSDTNFVDVNKNGAFDLGDTNYLDLNTNNIFDQGDVALDLPEPYLDANENKQFDSGEWFYDYNFNGTRDLEDHIFNGVCVSNNNSLCSALRQRSAISVSTVIIVP